MNVISQRCKSIFKTKNSYFPMDQSPCQEPGTSDKFPRYHPVEMPVTFNVWPPTPKFIENNKQQIMREPSFTYSLPEDYSMNASSWDPSVLGLPDHQSLSPHNIGIAQQFDSPIDDAYGGLLYGCKENTELSVAAQDMSNKPRSDCTNLLHELDLDGSQLGSSYGSDDNLSIADTSLYSFQSDMGLDSDSLSVMTNSSHRISDASTLDHWSDVSQHYGGSALYREYTHRAPISRSSLSPAVSPRQSARMPTRTNSRKRSSPSPHSTIRASPYPVDCSRNERLSKGAHHPAANKNPTYPSMRLDNLLPRSRSEQSCAVRLSAYPHSHVHLEGSHMSNQLLFSHGNGIPLHAGGFMHGSYIENVAMSIPNPLLQNIVASSFDAHCNQYADLSDPPDLYASLREKQLPPPPEDMNPEDPDMKPHEQDLRYEGDLYTPRWVRNHGNKREGWCGICKPGRWLVLKNSAFWYDKSFTHGISAATGQQFTEPKEVRRVDGNPDLWEGLCHSCNEWVALVSNKKKGTTWFRHAYKCHTHPKIKDAIKRRRESKSANSAAAKGKDVSSSFAGELLATVDLLEP